MFAPTNFFRAAARHAHRLRPVPLAANISRQLSSTPVHMAEGGNSSDHASLVRDLQEADKTLKARAQATASASRSNLVPRMYPRWFLEPSDFGMARRMRDKNTVPRKFWKIGQSRAQAERNDIFRQHNIDPLHEALNSKLMSDHVTELGKIPSRAETNLTWRSQRKLGKAIRRAKMLGIIPLHSRRILRYDRAY
ncbi:hypothetical protein PHLGIDRAFT_24255 [Phlebiopsis gigantea 11061_1 CR5-6]|uniref:Small ribosomal subunit protein bS18m n=1 Tax=Phlebiopsis gigantea (strain 11061_1 CR5-6) TaxID=745531 RepID=A0A0C3PKV6_PHLG1|nr:hypothetical protein PHLGIDRAFT_24255 [Phlebiopsis gigantea 11061_1 CR5-6]